MSALDDIAIIGVAGAIGLVAWEVAHVKIPSIPSPASIFAASGIGQAATNVANTATNANQTQSWIAVGVPQNDYCSLIASWRSSGDVQGIFGIKLFTHDPMDYAAFTSWALIAGIDVPATPPTCWNEAVSPSGNIGGLGY